MLYNEMVKVWFFTPTSLENNLKGLDSPIDQSRIAILELEEKDMSILALAANNCQANLIP